MPKLQPGYLDSPTEHQNPQPTQLIENWWTHLNMM